MQIDYENLSIHLGVGELSRFRLGPRDAGEGTRVGRWRMESGSMWHRRLQDEVTSRAAVDSPDAKPEFEVVVSGVIMYEGWRFELQGRVDQIIFNAGRAVIREVKTVSHPLPLREDVLRSMYSGYFAQAAAYEVICALNPEKGLENARAELLFVDLHEGARQIVTAGSDARAAFDSRIRLLWEFAQSRRGSRMRMISAEIAPPFDAQRPGQEGTEKALYDACLGSRIVMWEAPTGFGKTAYALHNALSRMKSGLFERAIYLTGRSTGQLQVVREMHRRWGLVARFQQMRSRAEHAIRSAMHTCGEGPSCRDGIEDAWARSGISPARLAEAGPLDLETARDLGAKTGVCPFEITKAVLPFADIWIGDLNYVFHPRASGVFLDQPGFDAGKTLLIIDEAHNLPGRVADSWSANLDARHIEDLCVELSFAHPPDRLRRSLESLQSYIARLGKSDRHDDTVFYEVRDLVFEYARAMEETPLDVETLRTGALDALWELADDSLPFENEKLELLLWSPVRGTLSVTCIDASREISAKLKEFGSVLMMSATLRPVENFLTSCGLESGDAAFMRSTAPWRGMGYSVAVDVRADTRLKSRRRSIPLTALTIADMCVSSSEKGPVAAIFPSYKYAQDVAEALAVSDEGMNLRVAIQPRGLDLEGQRAFVEGSLANFDVLMLVLGSGFTEGIDALGGRVTRAIVVSPALPEADAVQAARVEKAGGQGGLRAFHDVYIVPGIRKVNQAMGRLVRAPGQHAKVLLHCHRFAQPDYAALLDEDFAPNATIRTREELVAWLNEA
jgi:DNA excision repair protein ERCC-2